MRPSYLRRFPRFAGLTDDDVEILERVMVVEHFPAGHVFVREGDLATAITAAMYIVIEGTVDVAAFRPRGGFAIHRTLGPGDLFGHISLVAYVPRTSTCVASTAVMTARMDRLVFEELYRHDVGVEARFQLVVARQLASDARSLHDLLAHSIATGDEAKIRERYG